MKPIGGYFELELDSTHHFPHEEGALVNSGRNALEYILRGIGNISKIYIPNYTCEVVLEPLHRLSIPYEFYHINLNLEISELPIIADGEYILVNNYFGIKDAYIEALCEDLAGKIIVDNSQAFFTPQYNNEPTFWSPRKFVGVPDGGIALPRYSAEIDEQDVSYDRCLHLLKRLDLGAPSAYLDFQVNDDKLIGRSLMRMSQLTEAMLKSISYDKIKQKRSANYTKLRETLETSNLITTPRAEDISCPMVYPYLSDDNDLRKHLIDNKIFVATYWPNVFDWCNESDIDYNFAKNLIPLPVDQRYGKEEMYLIIKIIEEHEKRNIH